MDWALFSFMLPPHLRMIWYVFPFIEHIGLLARMSVLVTEVDGSNPGSSMLFP